VRDPGLPLEDAGALQLDPGADHGVRLERTGEGAPYAEQTGR
jgi:hypothetical protein